MFVQFFLSVQQDIKLWIFFPILCAVFRAIFIAVHKPYPSLAGKGKALRECFRFGFWWGMDLNAYVFVISLILVTLPGLFFGFWHDAGDGIRIFLGLLYAFVLYCAFVGKMIFYSQFHDIFNNIVFLGEKAEKHNLVDVFFNQYHGARKLALIVPYMIVVYGVLQAFLHIPSLPYPPLHGFFYYSFNTVFVLALIAAFYFFRYGGTFMHDNKPEWDTIPAVVKEDPFLAKATVDDLIALKILRRHPMNETLQQSPQKNLDLVRPFIEAKGGSVASFDQAMAAFRHTAKGAKIKAPSHIFLIVGESYSQPYFDPAFADLHIADEGKRFMADPHTAVIPTALSAGIISRPSIVSLMLGIFDAGLELNEREAFWQGTMPTSLPLQLRKLGYETNYWYGGSLANGNFGHFAPACGFDHAYSAIDICDPKAPRSWVGVYDHIFLNKAAEMIRQRTDEKPQFHFIYTTSNHGPYKMPLHDLGFDGDKIMKVQQDVLDEKIIPKVLGTFWYSDRAINHFIDEMKAAYPDSLFIVTGDHGFQCSELQHTSFMKREYTFRELHSPVLMFQHPQLDAHSLADNHIGGHMNIMPTLFELIAPAGFTYYSLFDSLTEPVPYCVTPYHWVNQEAIGACHADHYQALTAKSGTDIIQGNAPYDDTCEAEKSLTAYLLQRPELLQPAEDLLKQ
ncbi:LTA synthase family protein [uncultured Megasphaera sp.]|uniref:LTA synthase family protein n=1 Tax=uncultured Megasphaera sp. TaxID=165188 RepID=UPI0025E8A3AE|nr:LTA synthase family protein [uncultured Megasphaera sp.]